MPLEKVYGYEPVPEVLNASEAKHILGVQANLWTEYIPEARHAEYMMLPRLSALAEIAWTQPELKNLDGLMGRLKKQFLRFDQMGINYRLTTPEFTPNGGDVMLDTQQKVEVKLNNDVPGPVYYTLDGSEPSAASTLYAGPIVLEKTAALKARTIMASGKQSPVVTALFSFVDPKVNGVEYTYYEGVWTVLPNFDSLTPVRTGRVYEFNLSNIKTREEQFAVRFTSVIDIPTGGAYTFFAKSDDGSRLLVDGRVVVDNDGMHGEQESSGVVMLSAGRHAIAVYYLQGTGGQMLEVSYQGPGMEKRVIPAGVLSQK